MVRWAPRVTADCRIEILDRAKIVQGVLWNLEKTKAGKSSIHRPSGVANWLRNSTSISTLSKTVSLVNCATVLAAGFEPTRALAQQLVESHGSLIATFALGTPSFLRGLGRFFAVCVSSAGAGTQGRGAETLEHFVRSFAITLGGR